jgi:hypothetical protein
LDQDYLYHLNLLKNDSLYADFLHNYFPGLMPTGETVFNVILEKYEHKQILVRLIKASYYILIQTRQCSGYLVQLFPNFSASRTTLNAKVLRREQSTIDLYRIGGPLVVRGPDFGNNFCILLFEFMIRIFIFVLLK